MQELEQQTNERINKLIVYIYNVYVCIYVYIHWPRDFILFISKKMWFSVDCTMGAFKQERLPKMASSISFMMMHHGICGAYSYSP